MITDKFPGSEWPTETSQRLRSTLLLKPGKKLFPATQVIYHWPFSPSPLIHGSISIDPIKPIDIRYFKPRSGSCTALSLGYPRKIELTMHAVAGYWKPAGEVSTSSSGIGSPQSNALSEWSQLDRLGCPVEFAYPTEPNFIPGGKPHMRGAKRQKQLSSTREEET